MKSPCFLSALLLAATLHAADIPVAPGDGTITAAAANAKPGDVLVLQKGEYRGSATIPADVTLRGAGADQTVVIGTSNAVLNCAGPRVTITDLELRAGDKSRRGVNTSAAVRIERVRFTKLPEAAALMGAPLSDIVFCDFLDCDIGVRAIAGACPTVYGCVFSGGRTGVFALDGAPYIRNNLFLKNKEGIRYIPGEMAVIRNNTFAACEEAGINIIKTEKSFFGPAVRNSVFDNCGAAVLTDKSLTRSLTHALVHNVKQPWFHDEKGAASVDAAAPTITEGDPKMTISDTFAVTFGDRSALDEHGAPLPTDAKDAKGVIGPDGLTQFGVRAPKDAPMPPIRWNEPDLIANAVAEEYQTMQMLGLRMARQSLTKGPKGNRVDKIDVGGGKSLTFDIERFFSESSIGSK